jgi:ATP-dependent helicase HrpB
VTLSPLPIDGAVADIVARVRAARAAVVVAAPGAGKTTRVPPALAEDGPVIVLQPRRIAARTIARRIAEERGWAVGEEVGWQVRFERQFGPRTRLLVVTEGVLTARLQADALLSSFRTIVLDEFHERSIHADLGLSLVRQAWLARDDLRIVVMSATLDGARVARFLGGCPVIDVPGAGHPIAITYAPGQKIADAVLELTGASSGQLLCFLPGAREIAEVGRELEKRCQDFDIVPLHGSLDAAAQDEAVRPVSQRRILLATNIAETSLTVPGVTAVVDSGLHKVARYDPARGIDSLDVERITQDAADQRAGRAGRLGPGLVRRLWDARDRLRPHREPEILRIDLAAAVLNVLAWGGDPRRLEWFEPPGGDALDGAFALLMRLGAVEGGRITELGRQLQRLPVHPRLGRIVVAAGATREAAAACAWLSERHAVAPRRASASSDLLGVLDEWPSMPAHVRRAAEEIQSMAGRLDVGERRRGFDEAAFRRALLAGYPDRVARRRGPGSPRVLLATGHGAIVAPESAVVSGEFLVAIDVRAGRRGEAGEALIRLASLVEREWLSPTNCEVVHAVDPVSGRVRATRVDRYGQIPLAERPVEPDAERAAALLADALIRRGPSTQEDQLLRRLRFAGRAASFEDLVRRACDGCCSLAEVSLTRSLPADLVRDLERLAPSTIAVPSGRRVRLEYRADGSATASVKLQELFGLAETPRIGARHEPVTLELVGPNGRPVQVTRDLRSFWDRTYPDVRRELRGRYPKHPWPEDPWTAQPTGRPNPRRSR